MSLLLRLSLVATTMLMVTACAGGELRTRADTIGELITTAKKNGAQKCAPVELAMAESHQDFAIQDMSEGNYFPAKENLSISEKNAHSAIQKSPADKCLDKPKVVEIGDSDKDGIKDDVDKCPEEPEDIDRFEDADGCPDLDNDKDGLADRIDDCPNKPEDKDGYRDDDGCPDRDNDNDGLADAVDKCPDEPEDKDGFEDDDGCPDCDNDGDGVPECPKVVDRCPDEYAQTADGCKPRYKLVVVTKTKIELKQTIYFDTGKARIKEISFPLLNEVAKALQDLPAIRVRIEGHTDSRGSVRYNLRLSDSRAASVRDYLIRAGVAANRMVSQGFGEGVPIADNRTGSGRDQNRRVEFVILNPKSNTEIKTTEETKSE